MKDSIYDAVFEVYELRYKTLKEKDTVRRFIKRAFKKSFKDRTDWSALSQYEKNYFIYIIIKDTMLARYVKPIKQSVKIRQKINNFLSETLFLADNQQAKYNETMSEIHTIYYQDSNSKNEQRKKYKEFCDTLSSINDKVPIPAFEEWLSENASKPLRIYDYIMSFYREIEEQYFAGNTPSCSQAEVDHVLLQILVKIVAKEHDIEINTSLIEECLSYLNNYHIQDFEPFLAEYDPALPLSKEKQHEIIKGNKKYMHYKTMLDNLNFY